MAKLLAEEKAQESGTRVPLYKSENETGRGNRGPASIAASQMGVSKRSVNRALANEVAHLQYREQIAGRLRGEKHLEEFFEKLDQGEILTGPSDLKLFTELPRDRMKQLFEHVLKTSTFKEAQDREVEEDGNQGDIATLDKIKPQTTDTSQPVWNNVEEEALARIEKEHGQKIAQALRDGTVPISGRDLIRRSKLTQNLVHYIIDLHWNLNDALSYERDALGFVKPGG